MLYRLALLAFVLTLVVGGSLSSGTSADAAPSGRAGWLTFMRQDALGHWQVWVAGTKLTRARQITFGNANSGYPVWSPDGRKIAFDSDRNDPNPKDQTVVNDVLTMNPDGSSVTNLTGSIGGESTDPAWSPDGSLIAFNSDLGDYPSRQGIYVMRPNGTQVRRVTTLPTGGSSDRAPRFSPDGCRLVFTRFAKGSALFTTDLGGHTKQITSYAIGAEDAAWSPRGERIVFEAYSGPTSRGDIFAVDASGRNLRNLTRFTPASGNGASDPVWSPDGRTILFLQGIQQPGSRVFGLALMRPDGSRRHFIQKRPIESHQPDWLADPTRTRR